MDKNQSISTLPYFGKAAKYSQYRWDYAPLAIQTICEEAHIGPQSCIADIGAGTGILTHHFVGSAGLVYAVEPDAAMLSWAYTSLSAFSSFHGIVACAEATTLPEHSVDVITVGQALHWFEPDATRHEFTRILKSDGWLAVVWNHPNESALWKALGNVLTTENGWKTILAANRPPQSSCSLYFGSSAFHQLTFQNSRLESWEEFIGSLCSDSHAPDEDTTAFEQLSREVRQVFDRFSQSGFVKVGYATELCLGHMYLPGRHMPE